MSADDSESFKKMMEQDEVDFDFLSRNESNIDVESQNQRNNDVR